MSDRARMIDEAVRRVWANMPAPRPCAPRSEFRDFGVWRLFDISKAVDDIRAEFRRLADAPDFKAFRASPRRRWSSILAGTSGKVDG